MKLKKWIKQKRITQAEFAEMIGYDSAHLSQVMNDKRKMSRRFEVIVGYQTKGAVDGAADILNDPKGGSQALCV